MKSILTVLFSFVFLVSGFSQTRNVVVGTNDVIVSPTNFWNANATNARSALGLSSVATSSIISIASGGTGATNAAGARTNLGLGATNDVIFADITLTEFGEDDVSVENSSGSILLRQTTNVLVEFGTGAFHLFYNAIGFNNTTNAAVTRTNLGLGATWLTNTNVTNFRSAIGLGATNVVDFGEATINGTLEITDGNQIYVNGEIGMNGDFRFDKAVLFNNPSGTRTNLGLGATWLTNTNVTNFRTAVGLGATNEVSFEVVNTVSGLRVFNGTNILVYIGEDVSEFETGVYIGGQVGISFSTNGAAASTRTNLGLGWPALTNSNAGTGLVSVNTNGEVVSPTNFWQQAPIQTVVQNLAPITNSTNAATNARNLYVYSLATNITGVTNTVTLPTNTSTFAGDSATIIHQGPTSSVTAVRQAGSTNNLITINRFDESVKFIYENGDWTTYHNISFQEPIYFSGTNTTANAATSRTNLGLPLAALTNTNAAGFQRAIFTTNAAPTNSANVNTVNFNTAVAWIEISVVTNSVTNSYRIPVFQ